ncbi:hypothetical protein ACWCQK_32010 [Streptomyces sp. NPDC002306]
MTATSPPVAAPLRQRTGGQVTVSSAATHPGAEIDARITELTP